MDWNDYDAALFDLDGVITPTAEVHMRAWAQMFGDFLQERGIAEPYTDDDYYTYVDGKPRYEGVRSFLASRGIELPEGDPGDPPSSESVAGLGNRKNADFEQILRDRRRRALSRLGQARQRAGRARHQDGDRVELAQRPGGAARGRR